MHNDLFQTNLTIAIKLIKIIIYHYKLTVIKSIRDNKFLNNSLGSWN